jgi:PIN domain nuclease of toxin-antitoxin system
MNEVILDSSALLALIKKEPGAEIVEKLIGNVIMSSINLSEVAATLLDSDMSVEECQECIEPFIEKIIAFGKEESFSTAALKKLTKHKGLSQGDRACISLGLSTGYPIYTADKVWAQLDLNCIINLIR